jgi:hypothetical protein
LQVCPASSNLAAGEADRIKSLDVVETPDPAETNERIAAAKLSADRLNAALPKLRGKLEAAISAEAKDRWWSRYKSTKAKLEAKVEQFNTYAQHAQAIASLLDTKELDKEISDLNGSAPAGIDRRLRSVELTARGLGSFSRDQPSLASTVVLPRWDASARNLWPQRPSTSLAAAYADIGSVVPHAAGARWGEPDEVARQKAGIESDQARSAAFHEAAQKSEEDRVNREERERFQQQRRG